MKQEPKSAGSSTVGRIVGCPLCEVGHPVDDQGYHIPTQAKGMIPYGLPCLKIHPPNAAVSGGGTPYTARACSALDRAIEHAMAVAESYATTDPKCKCANEHWQLAAWLTELKLRQKLDAQNADLTGSLKPGKGPHAD